MKTYTYSEARQRLKCLLDEARREGQVQIRRRDGSVFLLQAVRPTESPLDVPGVKSRLRRGELVELVATERERSGDAVLRVLSNKSLQRKKARSNPGDDATE